MYVFAFWDAQRHSFFILKRKGLDEKDLRFLSFSSFNKFVVALLFQSCKQCAAWNRLASYMYYFPVNENAFMVCWNGAEESVETGLFS